MKKYYVIISVLCSLLFFVACFNMPIGYYTFTRIVVCIASVIMLFGAIKREKHVIAIVYGVIAILFNPIFPIYLHNKTTWVVIDLICALWFVFESIINYKKNDI